MLATNTARHEPAATGQRSGGQVTSSCTGGCTLGRPRVQARMLQDWWVSGGAALLTSMAAAPGSGSWASRVVSVRKLGVVQRKQAAAAAQRMLRGQRTRAAAPTRKSTRRPL